MQEQRPFHIFTVGWEPSIIRDLATPIGICTGIHFTHGLVGDRSRLPIVQKAFPEIDFIALSKGKHEPLPIPDYELLASLESIGVPTIRSMVQGDRVLRNRPASESLGYATLLARRIRSSLTELQPDVVLGSFDSLHSALSLAVAKTLGIPWVAMAFRAIPDNLSGFCKGVMPESLVPIVRPHDDKLLSQAEEVFWNVRSNRQRVLAYRAPVSFWQRVQKLHTYGRNFIRRVAKSKDIGMDRFTYPTASERLRDIVRRSINTMRLPTCQMLSEPPDTRFAFFPLHMQPESTIDTWGIFYQDQLALIRQLALAVPADVQFVVKLHFRDPDNYSRNQLMQLLQIPGLKIAHPNSPSYLYLQKAALVIGIQGTACLEAALLGKPVIIFGDSPYRHFPRTEEGKRPDELHQQISRMLELPPPSDAAIVEAFAAYMARYMPGRINDWRRPIEEEELVLLTECFLRLQAFIEAPTNRANWYNEPPFVSTQSSKLAPLS
jgi:hypothetical protein